MITAALIGAVAAWMVAWLVVNLACWYFLAHRTYGSPWNWRVLLGARAYATWEDRYYLSEP